MDEEKKICRCGNTIDSPLVTPKAKYNKMGYAMLSLAFSAKPIEIIFQCIKCGDILNRSKDPAVIEKYRFNSDIFRE